MTRWDDDLDLVPASEYVPTMVAVLLRRAGLTDAPRAEQEQAIRDYLKRHQLSSMMEYSIRANGFEDLLGSTGE